MLSGKVLDVFWRSNGEGGTLSVEGKYGKALLSNFAERNRLFFLSVSPRTLENVATMMDRRGEI